MKKLYTILLAASVVASASADIKKAPRISDFNGTKAIRTEVVSKTGDIIARPTGSTRNDITAPAKAAPTTINELIGIYKADYYSYRAKGDASSFLYISAGENANTVKIEGLLKPNATVTGTVDFAAGTIKIPTQISCPRQPDGTTNVDELLCPATVSANQSIEENRNGELTLKINADGSITSDDIFIFSVQDMPGYSYGIFQDLVITADDDSYNTIARYNGLETDQEYNYILDGVLMPTIGFGNATYYEDFVSGNESFGESVVLSDFIYTLDETTTKIWNIVAQIDRNPDGFFIDMWNWTDIILDNENYATAIASQSSDGIEGTINGNTMSWTGTWGAFAFTASDQAAGWYDLFKDCTLTLPFNLNDNAGINDVTVDNNENAPVEYYNLQGMRINEPAAGQIVLRRQGSKTTKILVK